jgi:hypothetical protein
VGGSIEKGRLPTTKATRVPDTWGGDEKKLCTEMAVGSLQEL